MGTSSSKIAFEICVVSGDYHGDELGPGVNMVMFDTNSVQSPTITLDNIFQDEVDHSQAKFTLHLQNWSRLKAFGRLHHIEFWCSSNRHPKPSWFLDRVIIRDRRYGMTAEWKYFFFPVHVWIEMEQQYVVHDCQSWLPQHDPFPDIRDDELGARIEAFTFTQRGQGLPVEWSIEPLVLEVIQQTGLADDYASDANWDSLNSLGSIYEKHNITKPVGLQFWMVNDVCFGAQRVKGCNPFIISLCRELPPEFEHIADCVKPYLEGWTLEQLVSARRLYIADYYQLMTGLKCKKGRQLCAPLVLFFHSAKRQLRPIAIQLNPPSSPATKDGKNKKEASSSSSPSSTSTSSTSSYANPVFLPTDPLELWFQVKLWVNLADACHHLVVGRLLTHIILESIYVSMRRNLAQSHPIYQLLAPHFRSILPVTDKLKEWSFGNGWISRNIQLTRNGIKQLLKRGFNQWRFDIQANIYRELESRGVYDPDGLGNYPYRQDALVIYKIFERFVDSYVRTVYPRGPEDLANDSELQAWRQEVATPMEEGGLGIVGVPGSSSKMRSRAFVCGSSELYNEDASSTTSSPQHDASQEGLLTIEQTVKFVVGLLHLIVIVAGSALRLPVYDEYGFPGHYPLSLYGEPPRDNCRASTTTGKSSARRGQRRRHHHGDSGTNSSSSSNSSSSTPSLPSMSNLSIGSRLDQVVAEVLPNRQSTVEVILFTRLASRVQQSVLGAFESDFIFKPQLVKLLEKFRQELRQAAGQIDNHNLARDMHHQYRALDPSLMPNYPGI